MLSFFRQSKMTTHTKVTLWSILAEFIPHVSLAKLCLVQWVRFGFGRRLVTLVLINTFSEFGNTVGKCTL